MNWLDWTIVIFYLAAMIVMSLFLGRRQKNHKDYYLGGNSMNHWAISISTMATQCSTNSLLGAPAFVIAVGGLLWLQYELAVPLAMIGVMTFLLPFFRRMHVVSVYEYLEKRFGPASRLILSVMFQLLRAFSTGVTVYGISIVIQELVGIPFWQAVLLLGAVTVVYDFIGGIKAVVFSDVIQMAVLYTGIIVCLFYAVKLTGGWSAMWAAFPADKAVTLDFRGLGLSDGRTFSFWPMLIGGFFLYLSYYGCDQTQVQRELSTRNVDDCNMSLFINGLLRFPLVLTYCLVGVAIGAFIVINPGFLDHLILDGRVNYNMAVPKFCLLYLPHGIIGLVVVSLFAAAMSSLDSTINSLSASTMQDVLVRFVFRRELSPGKQLLYSRYVTVFWGAVCVMFSFFVEDISSSIIESINKIGSLANGPILAAFLLAVLTRRTSDAGAASGIIAGFITNLALWKFAPGVSWLWWNVAGCAVGFAAGCLVSIFRPCMKSREDLEGLVYHRDEASFGYGRRWGRYKAVLVLYFLLITLVLYVMQRLIAH